MQQTKAQRFIEQVSKDGLKVINQPDIIWLFGSGAEEIRDINASKTDSRRASFYRWLFAEKPSNANSYKTPEHYPDWVNINNGYTNLVDLEVDLVSVAKATVVFSESVGAFAEIGILSCQNKELLKSLVVVVDKEHLEGKNQGGSLDDSNSFMNLGPFQKIRLSYTDPDEAPIIGFENTNIENQFQEIELKIQDIANQNKTQKFDIQNRKHQFLLLLDIIHLLGSSKKSDLKVVLEHFGFAPEMTELTKMLRLLILINLIDKRSDKNPVYELHNRNTHKELIDFTGVGKKFDRSNFIINSGERA